MFHLNCTFESVYLGFERAFSIILLILLAHAKKRTSSTANDEVEILLTKAT